MDQPDKAKTAKFFKNLSDDDMQLILTTAWTAQKLDWITKKIKDLEEELDHFTGLQTLMNGRKLEGLQQVNQKNLHQQYKNWLSFAGFVEEL